jgi:hypothetical protein
MQDLLQKQQAFYVSGNTLDTRSRRAVLQILANTVKEVCGNDATFSAVNAQVQDFRKHLYKWSGTGKLRLLLSLFARPAQDGPIPYGTVLIDGRSATDAVALLSPLVAALASGNTAVVLTPGSSVGETVRSIIDDTFTDDYVAAPLPDPTDPVEEIPLDSFSFVYDCAAPLPTLGREGFLTFSTLASD